MNVGGLSALASRPEGGWVVKGTRDFRLLSQERSAEGGVIDFVPPTVGNTWPTSQQGAAATEEHLAFTFGSNTDGITHGPLTLQVFDRSGDLTAHETIGEEIPNLNSANRVMAPLERNLTIAWNRAGAVTEVEYSEYQPNGTKRCGPVTLVDTGNPRVTDVASHGDRVFVLWQTASSLEISVVGPGCQVVGAARLAETETFFEGASLATGDAGVFVTAITYTEGYADSLGLNRALGPNICDAPLAD